MIRGNLLAFFSTRWLLGSDGECYKTVKIALDSKIFFGCLLVSLARYRHPSLGAWRFFFDFLLTSHISLRWCFTKCSNFLCPTLAQPVREMCVETALSEISSLPNYKFSSLLLVVPKHHRRFHHHPRPHYGQWAGRSRVLLLLVACYNHFHHSFFSSLDLFFSGCVLCCVFDSLIFLRSPATLKKLKRRKKKLIIFDEWIFNLGCARVRIPSMCSLWLCLTSSPSPLRYMMEAILFFLSRTHLLHHTLSSLCRFLMLLAQSRFLHHTSLCCSFGVYLLLSIIFFFVCFSFAPIDKRVGVSVGQVRRRFVVVRSSSIIFQSLAPFRKQSNLIHRMWTRMFASMCFFSYTWKSPTTAHNRAAARESSSKRNTRKI